jgi:hypothetical protein
LVLLVVLGQGPKPKAWTKLVCIEKRVNKKEGSGEAAETSIYMATIVQKTK